MAEISMPAGAFAAIKAGKPVPTAAPVAAAPAPAEAKPKTELRKAPIIEAKKTLKPDPEPDAPPADMTPAEKKIWKLKADGEEFEFDASDEEAIKREIMRARGADKRFESAATLRRQAESFLSQLKDPTQLRKVLSHPEIGVDVKKFAEDYVWEQIQQEQREAEWKKDPAAKKRYEDEQELKSRREQDAAREAEGKTRAQQESQQRYEKGYEQKIMKALEIGGIPKTPEAASRMAEYLYRAVEQGIDLSPEEIVDQVRNDYMSDLTSVLGAADGEQLLALLGEQGAEKLRKADLKRLKSPQGNPFPARSAARQAAASAPSQPQKMGGSDWREAMKKDFLNRNR